MSARYFPICLRHNDKRKVVGRIIAAFCYMLLGPLAFMMRFLDPLALRKGKGGWKLRQRTASTLENARKP